MLAYDSFYWPPHGQGWPVSFFVVALVFAFYLLSGLPRAWRERRAGGRSFASRRRAGAPRGLGGGDVLRIHAHRVGGRDVVAVVAGVVGFFTVLRGSAFAAHAIPNGAFAGAAGASLIGVSTLAGLGAFSLLAAIGIALLGRRGRRDVVTALALVVMLALGALFLSVGEEYAPATTRCCSARCSG